MQPLRVTPESLAVAAAAIPSGTPVFMLNLLRYRNRADYGGRTDLPPCSGQEAYFQRYRLAFQKVTAGMGIKPVFVSNVLSILVTPDSEQWHNVAIVEYPSFDVLQRMLNDVAYKTEAEPHRLSALEDWRFIATAKLDLG